MRANRHEFYEINYSGSSEEIRRYCLYCSIAFESASRFMGFAEHWMAKRNLDC